MDRIHDPVPGALVSGISIASDAQFAMVVGNVGRIGLRAGLLAGIRKLKRKWTASLRPDDVIEG
jgi:hypothetical protein